MRVRGYAAATPCWAVHHSTDVAATAAFYTGLFGWTTATHHGDTVFLRRDLAVAGLAQIPDGAGQRSGWLTHISTDDIDTTSRLVVEAGGKMLRPATEWGGRGRSAVFADSLGAVVGAWQHGTTAGVAFAGAQVVGGMSMMDGGHYPPGTPPHWRTILQVGDCGEVVARTPELGGRVLAGPVDTGIGTAAYIADPTGGTFLVIEPLSELIAALN